MQGQVPGRKLKETRGIYEGLLSRSTERGSTRGVEVPHGLHGLARCELFFEPSTPSHTVPSLSRCRGSYA